MTLNLFGDQLIRDAEFWGDDIRVRLIRRWGPGKRVNFIGCNPSRAGKERDDPTCKWWMRWSQALSFGELVATNLYPFVTSSPAECRKIADYEANGPDWYARDRIMQNLDVVAKTAKAADLVVACWGAIAWDQMWIAHVVEAITTGPEPWPDIYCLGRTASGAPTHPMARGKHRLPIDVEPKIWRVAE